MPIIQILWKFKSWIAIAVFFFLWVFQIAYTNHLAGKLNKAELECEAKVNEISLNQAKAVAEKQIKLNAMSADYEKAKSEQRVQVETVTREVQKIIERPVYQQYCIDDDGLSEINSLITNNSS